MMNPAVAGTAVEAGKGRGRGDLGGLGEMRAAAAGLPGIPAAAAAASARGAAAERLRAGETGMGKEGEAEGKRRGPERPEPAGRVAREVRGETRNGVDALLLTGIAAPTEASTVEVAAGGEEGLASRRRWIRWLRSRRPMPVGRWSSSALRRRHAGGSRLSRRTRRRKGSRIQHPRSRFLRVIPRRRRWHTFWR